MLNKSDILFIGRADTSRCPLFLRFSNQFFTERDKAAAAFVVIVKASEKKIINGLGTIMILRYFNHTYFLTLFVCAGLIAALYFSLRKRSLFTKRIAVFALLQFNLVQHFFKCLIWPHLWGTGIGLINTAYNVCAFLIIISPFVFLGKNELLKQFVAYVGTIGASLAIIVPSWFIGSTIFTWEYLRSWTCHTVLIATSLLPALWGMVKFNYRDGWKFGLIFLMMLMLILSNNVVFMLAFDAATPETLYAALLAHNPLWMMAPSDGFESLGKVLAVFSPKMFLQTKTHPYIPILWYAFPMYILITLIAYLLGGLLDRKKLKGDFLALKSKLKKR